VVINYTPNMRIWKTPHSLSQILEWKIIYYEKLQPKLTPQTIHTIKKIWLFTGRIVLYYIVPPKSEFDFWTHWKCRNEIESFWRNRL
jgi:hypothetical protein